MQGIITKGKCIKRIRLIKLLLRSEILRIKYKMPVFLLPLIIIPVIATSLIFIRNTSRDAIRLHNEIMHLNLETIAAGITEEHLVLRVLNTNSFKY